MINANNETLDEQKNARKRSMNGNINEDTVNEVSVEEPVEEPVVNEEAEAWHNKYLYAMADFENLRRNAQKEKENTIKYASERVIKDLLPIVDDFERALSCAGEHDGIKLIYSKFINVLAKNNVSVIAPKNGEPFNELIHEAVTAIPATDGEPGTVVDCMTKGYAISDKVIRFAKVVVRQA